MDQLIDTQQPATTPPSGWSFLVAPRRTEGHRTVLAPDFLTERNRECLLLHSLPGDGPIASRCRVLIVDDELGSMTVVYTSDQLALGERVIDSDEHGRPLGVVYGVVTRGRCEGPVDEDDLRMARAQSLETYRRFIDRDDTSFPVESSRSFALQGDEPPTD